jgi:hypothetical protein
MDGKEPKVARANECNSAVTVMLVRYCVEDMLAGIEVIDTLRGDPRRRTWWNLGVPLLIGCSFAITHDFGIGLDLNPTYGAVCCLVPKWLYQYRLTELEARPNAEK